MRTVYLGQFTDEVANTIAGRFEEVGIAWSYKQAGFLSQIFFLGEWGTRLFVESDRLDDARKIADAVMNKVQRDE